MTENLMMQEYLRWVDGAAEDKMFRQHHGLNGHEFEQTPRDNGGQRGLATVHGVTQTQTRLSN